MLYLFQASLEKPADMTRADFYHLWEQESEAAIAFLQSGEALSAYKLAGADELIAIFDIVSNDRIDQIMQSLPIWRLNAQHMAKVRWTPLRAYADWYADLKILSGSKAKAEA
ncbi:MAG: Muconolactone delta-isomerase [Hydrocarboniphaga sp.]|uniref:muconolactone Delta-isomerase family protein n=1 Tax=Hydrocarboniphaga sp. TaxID=2033016 RepID=UPI00262A57BD|nr:muconolactone Delta-isomerase family protein [Hydrocarboniphaga sp.]MDB5971149.1 Muconolactone delta-isomerase [Hydrocarboniphaga sp.]